ncbi:MAG: ATP-binding cassette domain-containing protein, partial [Trebonia sp.]
DVLLLDEPTASLSSGEVRTLFELLRTLSRQGVAIGFVSHRLREVLEICDRVSVLRGGRCVASKSTAGLTEKDLVDLLVGVPLDQVYGSAREHTAGPRVLLEAHGLRGGALHELDLTLHEGEILGLAGLDGSGRELVSSLLVGAEPWEGGRVVLNGKSFERLNPDITVKNKVAYVPADRKTHSILPEFSLRENLTLPKIGTRRKGWLSLRAERRDTAGWLDRTHVDQRDVELPISALSGGNQQRVVIARWLRFGAQVMVLDEPTQGVDVAGRSAIYDCLSDAARAGTGLIIVSTDSEELVSVCDRVLVLFEGRVALDLDRKALSAGGTHVLDRAILSGPVKAEGVAG